MNINELAHQVATDNRKKIRDAINATWKDDIAASFDTGVRIEKDLSITLANNQKDIVETILDPTIPNIVITGARSGGKTFGVVSAIASVGTNGYRGVRNVKIGLTAPSEKQASRMITTFRSEIMSGSAFLRSQIDHKLSGNTKIVFKNGGLWEAFSGNEVSSQEGRHYDWMVCFPKGTKIAMANGTEKNIEDVVSGDIVITCDLETMQLQFEPVIRRIEKESEELIEITYVVDGHERVVKCTPTHPIITNRGEVCAEDLTEDDEVYAIS